MSTPGKLSLMTLALAGALVSPYSSGQSWSGGNLTVGSGTIINVSSGTALIVPAGAQGVLLNQGVISSDAGQGLSVASGTSITLISNDSGATIYGYTPALGNNGSIGSIINSGVIAGSTIAIGNNAYIGTIANLAADGSHAAGTLFGNIINASGATINGISNGGLISVNTGVLNSGSIGSIYNNGFISANNGAIWNTIGGTIGYVGNSGPLSGYSGVKNDGGIGTVSNSGTLYGFRYGIENTGSIGSIDNSGTLYGGRYGIDNAGTIGLIDNSGTLTSSYRYVLNNQSGSTIGSFNNSGLISVTTNASGGGIQNDGVLGTLSNNGTIMGQRGYSAIYNTGTGSIALLNNSGTIYVSGYTVIANQGVIGTLINSGLINGAIISASSGAGTSTIGTLINSGTITGGNNQNILNAGLIQVLNNTQHGLIASSTNGIYNTGTIGALNNSGTISIANPYGTNGAGVYNSGSISTLSNSGLIIASNPNGGYELGIHNDGFIALLSNSGTISASARTSGIAIGNTGTIGTLSNSGLLAAQTALFNGTGGTIGRLINSGTIAGSMINSTATGLTIYGGSGASFGTLTGYDGTLGSTVSGIGNIVSLGDLVFAGGNQLLNDNISINNGSGTVTNAAGILQVNNLITIAGDYYQSAAAKLAIGVSGNAVANGVSADTGYGRLVVTGDAIVEAGSSISLTKLPSSYGFAKGQRYVVIQASGSNTEYNDASLVYAVSGYRASGATVIETIGGSLYYDLVINIDGAATSSATTGNASNMLNSLLRYTGVNQALLDVFNSAIAITDPAEANKAGAQLSPAATAGAAASGSMAAFGAVQGAAGGRLDNVRTAQAGSGGSGVATGESAYAPAAWGRAFGGQANQAEREGIAGYHANYGGLMLGGDLQANSDWRVGGLVSYARTSIGNEGNNSGSGASVNSYGLTAYAGYDGKPWFINLTAGVASQRSSTHRTISYTGFSGTANGAFRGTLFTTTMQAGYPLALGDATITPLAGLRYSTLRQGGYTETGTAGATLTINGSTSSSLKSDVGAKVERSLVTGYGELKPFVQLSWNHEFRGTAMTLSGINAVDTTGTTAFTTQGASPLRNTAALSLGATLLQGKNLSLSARYTLEGVRGYTAQTGDLTVRWQY